MISEKSDFKVKASVAIPCFLCGEKSASLFFHLPQMPTQDGVFARSAESAAQVPTGDISLSFCDNCGYICNEGHEAEKIQFNTYDFSLAASPSFRAYIDLATQKLIEKYDLSGKQILDVGCGAGYFLREICRKGNNTGIGIDPGFDHKASGAASGEQVQFIQDYYSESYRHLKADLLVCRLVIDLLNEPVSFLKMIRANLESQPDTVVYFEVPHTEHNLEGACIWNLVYEHRSWFTKESLGYFFERCGFEVLDIYPCWQNEFLAIECRPSFLSSTPQPIIHPQLKTKALLITEALEDIKIRSMDRIERLRREKKKVIAWGAGARAVTFCNLFDVIDLIPVIVDVNTKRQGKYLPGSGQEVVAPDYVVAYQPDVVLITNPTYADEIKSQVRELGVDPEFWIL